MAMGNTKQNNVEQDPTLGRSLKDANVTILTMLEKVKTLINSNQKSILRMDGGIFPNDNDANNATAEAEPKGMHFDFKLKFPLNPKIKNPFVQ